MADGSKVEEFTDSEKLRVRVSLVKSRVNASSSGGIKSPVKLVTCRGISSDLLTTLFPNISSMVAEAYERYVSSSEVARFVRSLITFKSSLPRLTVIKVPSELLVELTRVRVWLGMACAFCRVM